MNDILLKSGTYHKLKKSEKSRVGGQSVYELINWYLQLEDPCCPKTIVGTTFITVEDGVFSADAGSSELPSYTFTGDLDTGIYQIAANNIGVSTGGTKRLDISSTGLGVVGTILNGNGAVGTPAYSFTSDPDTGHYRVGANQLGVATGGALRGMWSSLGLSVSAINELVTDAGIAINQTIVQRHTTFAVNTSATVAAANMLKGYFTSTSGAAVTLTLDTAANIGTAIGAVAGTQIDFFVDNTSGANTVTVAVAAGITAMTPVITGGATLTVSVANAIGHFRLYFSSASVAKLARIA